MPSLRLSEVLSARASSPSPSRRRRSAWTHSNSPPSTVSLPSTPAHSIARPSTLSASSCRPSSISTSLSSAASIASKPHSAPTPPRDSSAQPPAFVSLVAGADATAAPAKADLLLMPGAGCLKPYFTRQSSTGCCDFDAAAAAPLPFFLIYGKP